MVSVYVGGLSLFVGLCVLGVPWFAAICITCAAVNFVIAICNSAEK